MDALSLRPMVVADLPALLPMQQEAAAVGLADVFPQESHPFPRQVIHDRWMSELCDLGIAAYVATQRDGALVGFAARRDDEVLHFGTALASWGSGVATWLHDALVETFPVEYDTLRLRVFERNARGRRFYEKLGWVPTGVISQTTLPPYPVLLEYVLERSTPRGAR